MTKQQALREAADRIEGGRFYQWSSPSDCNVGYVAQVILDYDSADLRKITNFVRLDNPFHGTWSDMTPESVSYCQTTGIPIGDVFQALMDTGFSFDDIFDIENLTNEKALAAAGIKNNSIRITNDKIANLYRRFSREVVKYFRAWADLLDSQESCPEIRASAPSTDLLASKTALPELEPSIA